MGGIRGKIKGFPLFGAYGPFPYVDGYASAQYITEFLSFMRIVRIGGTSRFQGEPDGLHNVFLGIGDDPFRSVPAGFIRLFKIIGRGEDDLFLCFLTEKFIEIRAQHLEDIYQGGDGRRGEIPFQLGNKAFGKLCPVGKLFLGSAPSGLGAPLICFLYSYGNRPFLKRTYNKLKVY